MHYCFKVHNSGGESLMTTSREEYFVAQFTEMAENHYDIGMAKTVPHDVIIKGLFLF